MVDLVLSALPLVAGGLVAFLALDGVIHPDQPGSALPLVYIALLSALVIVSLAVTARKRGRPLAIRWLLLVLGVALFGSGEIAELALGVRDFWLEDVLRLSAYLPMAFFTFGVSAPLRLVARERSRRALTAAAVVALLVAAGLALAPYIVTRSFGWRDELREVLMASRSLLDLILFAPLLAVLGSAGLRKASVPYVLVAAGLLLLAASDVLFQYDFVTDIARYEEMAFACMVASLGYLILAFLMRLRTAPRAAD